MAQLDRYWILIAAGIFLLVAYFVRQDALVMSIGALLLLAGVFGPQIKILQAGPSGLRMELKTRLLRRVAKKIHLDIAAAVGDKVEAQTIADALAAETPETFADSLVDLVRLGSMALTGRVTDDSTHAPLDSVSVYVGIPGAFVWATTNASGEYIVDLEQVGAAPGSLWELYFVRDGYETTRSQKVRLPGKVQILNIEMRRADGGTGVPAPAPPGPGVLEPPPPSPR